ncbi:hypothetical protein Mal4_12610 [Maioricimonas rarisocia]|uniref:Major Facilitator Superfamily protein n=1 Tax=Maioricimonas rarisocia TaxID=2528026 RepID=A0A517Z3C2_9PLAN|nr:DUF5690 family protein [Maioricimonas rarisocia]QDU36958.1 hypothetical protein Mal4_12610 [Maioricimonas rarisocia]
MTQRSSGRLSEWLARQKTAVFSAWTVAAAFSTYFCMYAFRKPFSAGTFEDVTLAGLEYKTVLVVAQVLGYMISKFIGIKVISEMPPERRSAAIIGLIAVAEVALIGFGLVPAPWNFVCLFFNGLPLGMIFGLVLGYLEGRKLTEALTAGLCASFIISSGIMKSIGRLMIEDWGISEYWMPALTGGLFFLPLVVSVWLLRQIPAPNAEDIRRRSERVPMRASDRRAFFSHYAVGLSLLVIVYIALTVLRTMRDDFAVEIWRGLGHEAPPEIYTYSETWVMFIVVALNAMAILFSRNRSALVATLGMVAGCFAVAGLAAFAQMGEGLPAFQFMVLSGVCLYMPYVAMHTTIFERLIAATREPANLGFLMYVADAAGYLGYITVMLLRQYGEPGDILEFYLTTSVLISAGATIAVIATAGYFLWRLPAEDEPAVVPAVEPAEAV